MFIAIGRICLGLFFIILYFLFTSHKWNPEGYGKGIVKKYIGDERNNIRFYITFIDKGKEVNGESWDYENNGDYHSGDIVNISWEYNRLGDALLKIEDDNLKPIGEGNKWLAYIFLISGILIIIYALFSFQISIIDSGREWMKYVIENERF